MKQCPSCRTTYTDESLSFCLADGTPLTEMAEEGKLDPIVGRENEIEHIIVAAVLIRILNGAAVVFFKGIDLFLEAIYLAVIAEDIVINKLYL